MTRRLIEFAMYVPLVLVGISVACLASERRETPAVRAIKRARTAVVNIHTEKVAKETDSLFSGRRSRRVNGMGTGIVVDERGYIVTNYHVIANVESLRVSLADGSTYAGEIVSYDRKHDLAIMKISPSEPLDLMPLGTSSDLMLAETVIAVGNAFGYEDSVTAGIISSLSRDVEVNDEQAYENLIQTDASINPGNSGGPLINLDGEVVGINVAIRAGAQRIGFAIPIDKARRVIAKLLSIEQLSQTYHGVKTTDVKDGSTRLLKVEGYESNSPAEAAGFQPGDVILKVGTVGVVDGADLERALLGRSAGDSVDVVVQRNDQTKTLQLVLAKHESANIMVASDRVVRANNDDSPNDKTWRVLGMRLVPIGAEQRSLVEPRYRGGLRVTAVKPQSVASRNGIIPGDILVGLHVWETVSHENLLYVIDHPKLATFNPLRFYILRGNETLFGHFQLAGVPKR